MTLTTFTHRPRTILLEREARLCFINNAPNAVPSAELPKPENKIVAFLRGVPLLGRAVNALVSPLDITDEASIEAMVDHGQWINALQEADVAALTTKPAEPFDPNVAVTPQALFRAMTPDQRREVFFEYVDFFVPRQAQTDLKDEGDKFIEDPKARVAKLGDAGITKYKQALVGIVGIDPLEGAGNDDARDLAKKALATHYRMGLFPGTQVRGLDIQYADALKHNDFKGREPFATMPQALRDKVPASAFRGALTMGVIGTDELKVLNQTFLRHQQDIDVVHAQTASKLDQMGNITSNRLREEAKGIADIWGDLGGFEKIALLAAGAYLLTKKAGQYAAVGVAGLYFFQRFVMKDDDPTKTWSKNFNGALKYFGDSFKGPAENTTGYRSPNTIADPARRAETVVKFLDSFNRLNMESQAQGLAIMLEMPMDVLARNFQSTGPGTFALNLDASGTVDDSIRRMDPAMRRAFDDFFRVPSNRVMASEAMTYVFYRKAAEDPENKPDVEFIEHVLDRLPSGSISMLWRVDGRPEGGASHSRLPHAETQYLPQNGPSVPGTQGVPNAHSTPHDPSFDADIKRAGAAYVRLVERGRAKSVGDNSTLRTFMNTTFDFKSYTADRSTRSYTKKIAPGTAFGDAAGSAEHDLSGSANEDVAGTASGDRAGSAEGDAAGSAEGEGAGSANENQSGTANENASGSAADRVPGNADGRRAGVANERSSGGVRGNRPGTASENSSGTAEGDASGSPSERDADAPGGDASGGASGTPARGPLENRFSAPSRTRSGRPFDAPSGLPFGEASGSPERGRPGSSRENASGSVQDGAASGPANSPSGSTDGDANGSSNRDRPGTSNGRPNGAAEGE